jgi:hypothetical protein
MYYHCFLGNRQVFKKLYRWKYDEGFLLPMNVSLGKSASI